MIFACMCARDADSTYQEYVSTEALQASHILIIQSQRIIQTVIFMFHIKESNSQLEQDLWHFTLDENKLNEVVFLDPRNPLNLYIILYIKKIGKYGSELLEELFE